jgi:hypothetical protein
MNKLIVDQTGEVVCEKYEQDTPPPFMKTIGRVYSHPNPRVLTTVFDPVYSVVGKKGKS